VGPRSEASAPAVETPDRAEPPPAAPAAEPEEAAESAREGFTFSHRIIARDERVAVWLGASLGILLALVGFAVFLAARNNWLLDFAELDQMFGVAFGGETYEPRDVRTVRVYELDGVRVEETLPGPPPAGAEGLEVGNLEQSVYRTQADVPLLLIEGDLLNHDAHPHRAVFIQARLLRDGAPVSDVVAPVGRTLSQEELETILTPETLDGLYAVVAQEAASLVIQPNQRSRFSVVFPDFDDAHDVAELSYAVEIVRTEHPDAAGDWVRVEYQLDEDAAIGP
jgi:hypothetical protein